MKHTFTQADVGEARADWGCNCGPAALAFALQVHVEDVRSLIPDFEARGYTSPTMMRAALAAAGRSFDVCRAPQSRDMFHERVALVRIQWTGPWTEPLPRKWAARYTHWIVTWRGEPAVAGGSPHFIFDVNCGICTLDDWWTTAKAITDTINRADGGWYPANIWRLL